MIIPLIKPIDHWTVILVLQPYIDFLLISCELLP